ncbi:ribulokinase [Rhizobiales bacterium RZME27]|uniref:Ribulokinase n=1 Tax=Endobacterium cereale TaxID=2663029 RepID=A0A6A8AB12_9HYPH|nr:ribulokinase [Endobacterium cereale]MQY47097.1 ribulokinase [Endobacterium cereale]
MFSIGIDFGTNSVRAIVVRCSDGKEFGLGVVDYPSGRQGILLDEGNDLLARQNPRDYLLGLRQSVSQALVEAERDPAFSRDQIVGIGVDTTGSSPLPIDEHNVPLAFDPRFSDNLNAHCWLWRDHTSWQEAEDFTRIAAEHRPHYIAICGSTYSSEWWWAKIWHCLNVAPDVFDAAYSWVELADWIPSILAGKKDAQRIKRGMCAAGHKALYNRKWGGLPDREFLSMLDPKIGALRDRLYDWAQDASSPAGWLCGEWAAEFGLPEGIPIAIGAFDVHYGAIGSGIREGTLVKVIGTSTCDCAMVPVDHGVAEIPGICGIVEGSILPRFYGIEAGQSAVGDLFKWWVEEICDGSKDLHAELTREAQDLKPGQSGLLALDWNNGNRTILVDQRLSGLILGQTLHTSKAEIYRALVEATAFGARAIIERIRENGVKIDRVVCTGGIAEKNPMLMQIYADVTGCVMQVATSSQTCALGAAVAASVMAQFHPSFTVAQEAMTSVREAQYVPIAENRETYDRLYALYRQLHDSFGGLEPSADLTRLMKDLIDLKHAANR